MESSNQPPRVLGRRLAVEETRAVAGAMCGGNVTSTVLDTRPSVDCTREMSDSGTVSEAAGLTAGPAP